VTETFLAMPAELAVGPDFAAIRGGWRERLNKVAFGLTATGLKQNPG